MNDLLLLMYVVGLLATISVTVTGFSLPGMRSAGHRLKMSAGPSSDRERLLSRSAGFTKSMSILAGVAATSLTTGSAPALAFGALEEANNKLSSYGLPPIVFVPPGYQALVSEYGRGSNQKAMTNPILLEFCHPSGWVAQKTSVNNNGESGTVGANDYMKGDSANFFEYKLQNGEKVSGDKVDKGTYINIIEAALGRKGDVLERVKVLKIEPLTTGLKGEAYYRVFFSYSLNTEAGFLITRNGLLSVTNVGEYAECMVTGTTSKRWKISGMETKLKDIVDTFRVYKLDSGIFSTK
jgi:hypothetical protein